MVRNYFKIALRTLWKDKFYSAVNVIGLAIGLACSLIILVFLQHELSYDNFHPNADRIYRVGFDVSLGVGSKSIASTSHRLGPTLETDFPELEEVIHFSRVFQGEVQHDNIKFRETRMSFVDSAFFDFFSYEFIKGNPESVAVGPNQVVITEKVASRYFGEEEAIGKLLTIQHPYGSEDIEAVVAGVIREMPANSHFHMDVMISMATGESVFPRSLYSSWGWDSHYTYVRLPENLDPTEFQSRLLDFGSSHIEGDWFIKFFAQPVADIHLRSNKNSEIETNSDFRYIYIFSAVAIIILTLAAVNYMNLATARSIKRMQEVGIRKALGAFRQQLVAQFLGESLMLVLLAMIISGFIAELSMEFFSGLAGRTIELDLLTDLNLFLTFSITALALGLISGSYPAFFVSSYKPAIVLKGGKQGNSGRAALLRKILVTTQFALSIGLIIGTALVYNQWTYLRDKDLGVQVDQVLLVPATRDVRREYASVKQELSVLSSIKGVTTTNKQLGRDINNAGNIKTENDTGEIGDARISAVYGDYDFLSFHNATLVAGRFFSQEYASDTLRTIIMNVKATEALGFKDPANAVGRVIRQGGSNSSNRVIGHVVGVVEDFHFEQLYNEIKPITFFLWPERGLGYLSIKIEEGKTQQALSEIEAIWAKYETQRGFRYFFLNEELQSTYVTEAQFFTMFSIFSGLAIFTACLGILGLASFSATQRMKEIGIRKVLGASSANISLLLTKDTLKLVVISNIVAWPIAYFGISNWLSSFAYRTDIQITPFLVASVLAVIVAFLTVISQSLRAASRNPAKSIGSE